MRVLSSVLLVQLFQYPLCCVSGGNLGSLLFCNVLKLIKQISHLQKKRLHQTGYNIKKATAKKNK